jgi:hypothetical protein
MTTAAMVAYAYDQIDQARALADARPGNAGGDPLPDLSGRLRSGGVLGPGGKTAYRGGLAGAYQFAGVQQRTAQAVTQTRASEKAQPH